MLANHIKPDIDEYTTLFKLIGFMPLEFFSSKTVLDDKNSRSAIQKLICLPDSSLKSVLQDYLHTLFTVKAMSIQMPKFGKDVDLILKGMCKLLMSYEDCQWLQPTML